MASPVDATPTPGPPPSSADAVDNTLDSSFTFIMHSQNTLRDGQQPETSFDDRSAARTKRRRTSPEDVAVLEEEFSRDPRPGRDERARIARRVALGDKEVQIWFQNRRQAKRRKSRPSSGAEEASFSLELLSPSDDAPSSDSKLSPQFGATASFVSTLSNDSIISPLSTSILEPEGVSFTENVQASDSQQHELDQSSKPDVPRDDERPADSEQLPRSASDEKALTKTALRRTSSGVRLSLTSSGSAKILQEDESSPSPPKPISSPPQPEAQPNATVPRATRDRTNRQLFKSVSGRSTDARAWEFWCDADARNQLTKVAESECSGSAADAISVMRSAAQQRSALSPIVNRPRFGRVNSLRQKHEKQGERSKSSGKPTLARARSSIAKFQSDGAHDFEQPMHSLARREENVTSGKPYRPWPSRTRTSGSDSEKENRDPQTHRVEDPRPFGEYRKRSRPSTLGESKSAVIEMRSSRTQMTATTAINVDSEVEMFMKSGRSGDSRGLARSRSQGATGRDTADMDIVHGLLSLSQGNWR